MNRTAENLVALLAARGLKCAAAESCTGGLVASAIVGVPGASGVFQGSAVCYANSAKERTLGVGRATLETAGAVSAECAAEMAEGALRLFGADLAVSVTGIAGPDGGTPEKPVGLVWFGLASAGGATRTEKALFAGGRSEVRRQAAIHALGMLAAAAVAEGGGS